MALFCTYVVPAPKKGLTFLLMAGKIEISTQFLEDLGAVANLHNYWVSDHFVKKLRSTRITKPPPHIILLCFIEMILPNSN